MGRVCQCLCNHVLVFSIRHDVLPNCSKSDRIDYELECSNLFVRSWVCLCILLLPGKTCVQGTCGVHQKGHLEEQIVGNKICSFQKTIGRLKIDVYSVLDLLTKYCS